MDKNHLIKLLNLTSSSNDSEALSAMHKANLFLKENYTNWTEIINISDSLEKVIKREQDKYAILHMNLMKERSYSQELQNNFKFSKTILKYLLLFVVILIVVIILK